MTPPRVVCVVPSAATTVLQVQVLHEAVRAGVAAPSVTPRPQHVRPHSAQHGLQPSITAPQAPTPPSTHPPWLSATSCLNICT